MHKNMQRTDHPRIRGEHVAEMFKLPDHPGSSPHTRGARRHLHGMGYRRRIIPAYAGSTASSVCAFLAFVGSSPHTRGAHPAASHHALEERIIPAYAGSTYLPQGGKLTLSDHPRIRGEHVSGRRNPSTLNGSSPHTRGALAVALPVSGSIGIIPAYAGSTRTASRAGWTSSDHPRIRGEHFQKGDEAFPGGGSSPHTRGAPDPAARPDPPRRIIPAYAGSTAVGEIIH